MGTLTLTDIQLTLAIGLFLLGIATYGSGIIVLAARAVGRDMRTITRQTAKLTQKGITDELSGLVGNTSALLSSLNELMRTTAGIGIFLNIVGLLLIGTAYWFITQINWL